MQKTEGGWIPPPLGSLRVNKRKEFKQRSISKKLRIGLHQRGNLAKYGSRSPGSGRISGVAINL